MKSTIIIHVCVLLLTFVSDVVVGDKLTDILNSLKKMVKDDGNINGVFKPSKDGYLGNTMFSISYKGILLKKNNMEVTMKFTPGDSDHELKIYMDMGTIGNPHLEVYGVPSIHYFGMWGQNCTMMAMTLFDPGYHQTFGSNNLTETDLLILFREFVRMTQFTHGRSVFQQTIHLSQIIFFGEQCFINEFITAAKLLDGKNKHGRWAAREDWQHFIRTMYIYIQKSSHWNWIGFGDNDSHRTSSMQAFFSSLRNDIESNEPHKFSGLRRVFVEFARYALADDSTPITESFYNKPNRVIFEEIQRCEQNQGKKVKPSWLPNTQNNVQPSSSGRSRSQNRGETSSSSSRRHGR